MLNATIDLLTRLKILVPIKTGYKTQSEQSMLSMVSLWLSIAKFSAETAAGFESIECLWGIPQICMDEIEKIQR